MLLHNADSYSTVQGSDTTGDDSSNAVWYKINSNWYYIISTMQITKKTGAPR